MARSARKKKRQHPATVSFDPPGEGESWIVLRGRLIPATSNPSACSLEMNSQAEDLERCRSSYELHGESVQPAIVILVILLL